MTGGFEWAIRSVPDDPSNQDRAAVIEADDGVVLILADGAGGMAGGLTAAQAVVDRTREWVVGRGHLPDAVAWADLLRALDRSMAEEPFMGQTTAIGISVSAETVMGACVGDSEAWLIGPGRSTDLTANKRRKPLLGSGQAVPGAFGAPYGDQCVVVASDGLCRFVKPEAVTAAVVGDDLQHAADALVGSVRTPSGELWDDATVILCRMVRHGARGRARSRGS